MLMIGERNNGVLKGSRTKLVFIVLFLFLNIITIATVSINFNSKIITMILRDCLQFSLLVISEFK